MEHCLARCCMWLNIFCQNRTDIFCWLLLLLLLLLDNLDASDCNTMFYCVISIASLEYECTLRSRRRGGEPHIHQTLNVLKDYAA